MPKDNVVLGGGGGVVIGRNWEHKMAAPWYGAWLMDSTAKNQKSRVGN